MGKDIKYIDIKEFREKGYLQEINRQFLHPLGLALEIKINDDGGEVLGGVWDYREDEEGIYYDLKNSDQTRIDNFTRKENFIKSEQEIIGKNRENKLGFIVEPITEDKDYTLFMDLRNFFDTTCNITDKDSTTNKNPIIGKSKAWLVSIAIIPNVIPNDMAPVSPI